jgi:hypothetical protein
MQPSYDRSRRPAGTNDIMLGRKMGKGCQLQYADPPMSKRLTINKFADSDKKVPFSDDTKKAYKNFSQYLVKVRVHYVILYLNGQNLERTEKLPVLL